MSENMKLWNAVCRPPATALKPIGGGRLKGMTDINPQWRMLAMTENLGPIGVGWKYEIDKLWTAPVCQEQIAAFAQVNVYVQVRNEAGVTWSAPIPGIGGSMLVKMESGGLRADDEAFKMAVTDALSVALKTLGVGADIYMGRWDGSKYKDAPAERNPEPKPTKDGTWGDQINNAANAEELRAVWKAMPADQREAWAEEMKVKRKEFGV